MAKISPEGQEISRAVLIAGALIGTPSIAVAVIDGLAEGKLGQVGEVAAALALIAIVFSCTTAYLARHGIFDSNSNKSS